MTPAHTPRLFDGLRIPEGMIWKYSATSRGGRITHEWSLADKRGGIHIHAALSDWQGRKEWLGGIECHWCKAPDYMNPEKPSHDHCWPLGGPCWHDGSSLYFSENIAPTMPSPWADDPHVMTRRHHEYATYDLVRWHRDKVAENIGDVVGDAE